MHKLRKIGLVSEIRRKPCAGSRAVRDGAGWPAACSENGAAMRIEQYMSREPATIGKDEPLVAAHRLMQTNRIRHLPVIHQGRIVGVVSERDLYLLETLKNVDPRKEPVEEAMTAFPFTVPPDARLADVARQMWKHRYGSALVVEDGNLIGIFTRADALRALTEIDLKP
jgi:acetoin utilization protein AcuB